jgi:hypothetical protein
MTEQSSQSRRQALLTLAKAGGFGLGMLTILPACGTAADKRIKAKGGKLGEPLPGDPAIISRPWTPAHARDHGSTGVGTSPSGRGVPGGLVMRSEWAKGEPKPWLADKMGSIYRITIHHDAIDSPLPETNDRSSRAETAARLDSIRRGHLARGWADIGYHYAIDPSGQVWQGRPLGLQGAHVANQNQGNLGIVMLGNFERSKPTDRAIESLDRLIASEMRRYRVSLSEVRTHREMASTACPGRNLQRSMDRTRSNGGRLASLAMGDIRG